MVKEMSVSVSTDKCHSYLEINDYHREMSDKLRKMGGYYGDERLERGRLS
jgi:hypothetical protein